MSIVLYLRNRNAITLKRIAAIDTDDFRTITTTASAYKLQCLPFIDYMGDTILNHKQLIELMKEWFNKSNIIFHEG